MGCVEQGASSLIAAWMDALIVLAHSLRCGEAQECWTQVERYRTSMCSAVSVAACLFS